jgi:hypothetical protein
MLTITELVVIAATNSSLLPVSKRCRKVLGVLDQNLGRLRDLLNGGVACYLPTGAVVGTADDWSSPGGWQRIAWIDEGTARMCWHRCVRDVRPFSQELSELSRGQPLGGQERGQATATRH